jgi:hypothetical protein
LFGQRKIEEQMEKRKKRRLRRCRKIRYKEEEGI